MAPPLHQHSVHGPATIKEEPVETDPLASPKREIGDVFTKGETSKMAPPLPQISVHGPVTIKEEPVETDPLASPKREIEDVFIKEETLEIEEQMELASTGSASESTVGIGMEGNNSTDDSGGLFTKHKISAENKNGTRHLRSYTCNVCNKTYTTRQSLEIHSFLHTGKRPFTCELCNKTFTASKYLKNHSKLHSVECIISCNVCSKTFRRSDSLQRHSSIHTGERPYSCSVCNKTFTQSRYLKKHLGVNSHLARV